MKFSPKLWLCLLVPTLLGSCAGDSNYDLTITLASVPVVIDTTWKYNVPGLTPGELVEKDVPADWFPAFFHFKNNGTEAITIASIVVEVEVPTQSSLDGITSATDSTSTYQKARCEFTPYSDSALNTQSDQYLVTLASGADTRNYTNSDTSSMFPKGVGGYCSNLNFPDKTSFVTSAEITVNGWIGGPESAKGRLKHKKFTFKTE